MLHIVAAVQLTVINRAARPRGYETKRSIATSYAALFMRVSGMVLALFVVYHLLHLTAGAVGFKAGEYRTPQGLSQRGGRRSRSGMCRFFTSWRWPRLCLHLDHGFWSMFQTLGLNNAGISPALRVVSRVVALVVFAGFIAVPVAVLAGWLR